MRRSLPIFFVLALLFASLFAETLFAQESQPVSSTQALEELRNDQGGLTPEAVDALVARLSDQDVRQLLLDELGANGSGEEAPSGIDIAGLAGSAEDQLQSMGQRAGMLLAAIPQVPSAIATALDSLADGRGWNFYVLLVVGFAAMLGGGWLLERGYRQLAHRLYAAIEQRAFTTSGRLGQVGLSTALRLVGLLIFAVGGLAVFFTVWQGHQTTRVVIMTFFGAVIVTRLISIILRVLLSPDHPNHRIANFSDVDARLLYRQAMIVTVITTVGNAICAVYFVVGDQPAVHLLLLKLANIAIVASILVALIQARQSISADIRDDGTVQFRNHFARVWPGILIAYLIGLFIIFQIISFSGGHVSLLAGFGTFLAVLLLPHIDIGLERMARRLDREGQGGQIRSVLLRASRIGLFVVMVFFVAGIWGVNLFALAESGAGSRVADALVDIGMTALIAYILWETARIVIDRKMIAEAGPVETTDHGGEGGGQGASRLATLLPLIKGTIQTTIAVMAVMLMLAALGVNIGPLLAGAGVVGLAIGFGAQTLVRDVVSGLFFLVDDAFRVGEYVDVGQVKGTVEKISIRSLRLRHHRGPLNTIPFGEITHLTNFSRDWVIMKLEFRVPFDTDVQKVKRIFKQIGKELYANPEIQDDFLEPFKSQGVFSVDDSALVIRAKFTAKPGKQFVIRREAYLAVQRAFAENGIRFADRRVTVHVPEAAAMNDEQREKVEQAAASALASEPPKPAAA
ncbi:MAG: mechanosensitive ion channel domain-containing protein [Pseudomonadota bacterium]